MNCRAIGRSIVETISNYKDLIAQRDSKEKHKTSSYPASSPKDGGEASQKTAGASLKSNYKNTSRNVTIRGSENLCSVHVRHNFPTRQANAAFDAALIASQQKTCALAISLHKHKNEKTTI